MGAVSTVTTAKLSVPGRTMSTTANSPQTGKVALPVDPARRPDVLLRRRYPEGHQLSAWWMIGAFVAVSLAVVALVNVVPA